MTPEVLCSLIAGAETLDVEFKGEEARAISDGDLVEAVVCLANRPGNAPGWLFVGVEDDGRVTGARARPPAAPGRDGARRGARRAQGAELAPCRRHLSAAW